MITCTRVLEFDAGHRVMNHESKCATLHGHRYRVEVTAHGALGGTLDGIGRVIDFSVLKAKVGGWIDSMWDHTTLVFKDDLRTLEALQQLPRFKEPWVSPFNPTAENMADYLLRTICPDVLAGTGVQVVHIKVWETPNCWAEASL